VSEPPPNVPILPQFYKGPKKPFILNLSKKSKKMRKDL